MIADEEGIIGRENTFIKNGKWRFELRRPCGQANQFAFLRVFNERALSIGERKLGLAVPFRKSAKAGRA